MCAKFFGFVFMSMVIRSPASQPALIRDVCMILPSDIPNHISGVRSLVDKVLPQLRYQTSHNRVLTSTPSLWPIRHRSRTTLSEDLQELFQKCQQLSKSAPTARSILQREFHGIAYLDMSTVFVVSGRPQVYIESAGLSKPELDQCSL
jgi:hypothetical protein